MSDYKKKKHKLLFLKVSTTSLIPFLLKNSHIIQFRIISGVSLINIQIFDYYIVIPFADPVIIQSTQFILSYISSKSQTFTSYSNYKITNTIYQYLQQIIKIEDQFIKNHYINLSFAGISYYKS